MVLVKIGLVTAGYCGGEQYVGFIGWSGGHGYSLPNFGNIRIWVFGECSQLLV